MLQHKAGLVGIAACLALHVGPLRAEEVAEPVLRQFPPDRAVCFGRDYDKAHLAAHPQQKVTRFFLMRSLTDDPSREEKPRPQSDVATDNIEWEKTTRAEDSRSSGEKPGRSSLDVFVAMRNRTGVFKQSVECQQRGGKGFGCGVDCDGGGFGVDPDGANLLVKLGVTGLRVQSGCSSGDESEPEVRVEPGRDDKIFRLMPLPIAACHAARDAARPSWARTSEPPLRERFQQQASLCFSAAGNLPGPLGRQYSRLTLETLGALRQRTKDDGDEIPPDIRIKVSLIPANGTPSVRTLECRADDYTFDCSADNLGLRLTRREGGGATIRERFYEGGDLAKLFGLPAGKLSPIALEPARPDACRTSGN